MRDARSPTSCRRSSYARSRYTFSSAVSNSYAMTWFIAIPIATPLKSCEFGHLLSLVLKQTSQAFFLLLLRLFVDLILVGNNVAEERHHFVVGFQFDHAVEHPFHFNEDLVGQDDRFFQLGPHGGRVFDVFLYQF